MSFRGLATLSAGFALLAATLPGQTTDTIAKPLTEKQRARKETHLRKELEPTYIKWVREDVAWIITDEEKKALSQLGTDEEREQFVEQFWLRRDPTPETVENEYKEEHYRRIAWANAHFASGIPGWKTDRGRMYIRFGPPDEIEAHPSGGTWQRPPEQGGGTTSTYPFELWRYRHLDNVGDDIVIEFVDPSMSGEYRIAVDPCENDALLYVPGAGLTQAEQMGISTKTARFQNTNGTHCGAPIAGDNSSHNQFERLAMLSNIEKAPAIRFRDLEAVQSRITFNVLPMTTKIDYLRVTNFSVLANITLQFENRDLQFLRRDGMERATVHLLGRVYTMSRREAARFENPLEVLTPAGMLEQTARQKLVFQQTVPLSPGKYKLEILASDTVSGNVARTEIALDVPHFDEESLSASSLILADAIEPLPTKKTGGAMFAIGGQKVRPRVDAVFRNDEKMGIYLEIYNSSPSTAKVSYEIDHAGTNVPALRFTEDLKGTSQITIQKLLPVRNLGPGDYVLNLKAEQDDQSLQRQARFTVAP